jgi:hypothetical protein
MQAIVWQRAVEVEVENGGDKFLDECKLTAVSQLNHTKNAYLLSLEKC